jgi:hypothetical protein
MESSATVFLHKNLMANGVEPDETLREYCHSYWKSNGPRETLSRKFGNQERPYSAG